MEIIIIGIIIYLIYVVYKYKTGKKCSLCFGTGGLVANNTKTQCPQCGGSGRM